MKFHVNALTPIARITNKEMLKSDRSFATKDGLGSEAIIQLKRA
jgi:hypothetical protein